MKARAFKSKDWFKKPSVRKTRTRKAPKSSMRRGTKNELKFVDVSPTTTPIEAGSVATNIVLLNTCVNGTEYNNRIGHEISMKSVHFNATITPNGTNAAALSSEYVRVMIIYDRQTNKALPSYTDIIQGIVSNGGNSNTAYDGLNLINKKRFKVLMDERRLLPPIGISGASATNVNLTQCVNEEHNISRFIDLRGLSTEYNITNGGTVADINTGGLYFFVLGTATGTSVAYQITWSTRLRYYD